MASVASSSILGFDAQDLPPFIVCERTTAGWRGLTEEGEIYDVQTRMNGETALPERLCVMAKDGRALGYRALPKEPNPGVIAPYLTHIESAIALMKANELSAALPEIDQAIDFAATTRAHFNRAQILLGLGRWHEGFDAYDRCERTNAFMRPVYRDALEHGLKPWQGQDIGGKRLLLTHDHGFGDSIMCLRYVPRLKAMGADVTIMVPPELARLAAQMAPVTANTLRVIDCDYFCPLLLLLHVMKVTPQNVPLDPYLKVNPRTLLDWHRRVNEGRNTARPTIGVAWSVGVVHQGDYERSIPLEMLVEHFGRDADLVSVQQQGKDEADRYGVRNYAFDDFADCAALMTVCNHIVAVDTAALHLAGAIGHRKLTALLPHWTSWRWLSPLYRNVNFCRQTARGDWASALAQC
jgi:hypothetical protein